MEYLKVADRETGAVASAFEEVPYVGKPARRDQLGRRSNDLSDQLVRSGGGQMFCRDELQHTWFEPSNEIQVVPGYGSLRSLVGNLTESSSCTVDIAKNRERYSEVVPEGGGHGGPWTQRIHASDQKLSCSLMLVALQQQCCE